MHDSETIQHYIDVLLKDSNFTKAAKELSISQPYLTQLIKRIENKLGIKIINRNTIPFSLTEAGNIYYQYLTDATYNNLQLTQQLTQYIQPNKEIIKIGIEENLGTYILPKLLPRFLATKPDVNVQLFEAFPDQNENKLLNAQIDCYIGQSPELINSKFKIFTIQSEQYYVVIPSNSSFFKKGEFILSPNSIDLKKLLSQPLILNNLKSATRHQINGMLQKLHIKPNIVIESNSSTTSTALALKGVGITITTNNILKRFSKVPINLYPLNDSLLNLKIFLAINKDHKISQTTQELIKIFFKQNTTETI